MPQSFLLWSLVLTALCAPTWAIGQERSLPEDYRFAALLYKQQRWDQAAEAFRDFVKKNPSHDRVPYARLYLGLALVNADHLAEARQVLRDYARDYPNSKSRPDVVYRVGECSYLLDDWKSAETEFQQFLDQYPQHDLAEWALPYLADTKLRLKQPEAARQLFKKALEKYPQSRLVEDAKFGLARADEELNDLDAAAALYTQISENKAAGSHAAQSLMNLATIRFRTGKYEDASQLFRQLIVDFPKSRLLGAAQLNAGLSLYQLGQYRQAIEQFDKASADKKQAAAAGYWKGISLKALGDTVEAIKILKATYESDPKSAVAESTLFYWADCELRSTHYAIAQKLFLELAEKWTQAHDDLVRDSLHFAAEAALLGGSLDRAEELVARFNREFPNSKIALSEEILLARILDAKATLLLNRATDSNREAQREEANRLRQSAIQRLEKVLAISQLARTKTVAAFHLGRILQQVGEHARVVEVLNPLAQEAEQPAASSEAIESLVIWANSQSELGNQQAAASAYSKYLKLRPKGPQEQQALAGRALSNGRLGKTQAARDDALLLIKEFPQNAVGADTLRRLAERAYGAKQWASAGELFETLARQGTPETELRRIGLSGLGWSRFETARHEAPDKARKTFEASAAAFGQVFEKFPVRIPQVAEAGYMQGRALQSAGKPAEAAKAYAETFQKISQLSLDQDSRTNAGILQYGFMAGVQSANLLAQLKKFGESDMAYRAAIDRFPKARQAGQALFDWANMLYVAKKDAEQRRKVREILGRILHDYPESSAHDNARLFLAELDLVDGKSGAAEKTFREVLADPKADPKTREDGLSRLIAVAADREEWPSVRQLAEEFLSQFSKTPDAPLVRLNLAAAQLGLKEPAVAEKTLNDLKTQLAGSASELPEWAARTWILLAEAEYQQRKYDEVETTVEDLRRRLPKSPLFYQAEEVLGRSFKNQAQWDKAIAAFQRVIDQRAGARDVTAAKSRLMIAECWFLQKDFKQARTNYMKVALTYNMPEWAAPALFQAGQCAEALKQEDDAEKSYRLVIHDYPQTKFAEEAKKRLDELHKKSTG